MERLGVRSDIFLDLDGVTGFDPSVPMKGCRDIGIL